MGATPDSNSQAVPSELDQVVAEVVREAHVQADTLRPED